jgi:DNA-binding GntR family transcriptional regulator
MSAYHPDLLTSSADSAYTQIRQLLVSGEVAPGERLTEVGIAAQLGMSRTPVREAVRRLKSDGLVVVARRGFTPAALDSRQMRDIYAVRATLEALAAELAATRQRDGDLAPSCIIQLHELADTVAERAAQGDHRGVIAAELALHQGIADRADNDYLRAELGRIWDHMAISTAADLAARGWPTRLHDEHKRIVLAIDTGEPEKAAAAARAHVQDSMTAHQTALPQ